jgi:DNA-binding CsgD family transcriptional regulator
MSDIKKKLNRELLKSKTLGVSYSQELELYKNIAKNYAKIENAIAVLSDMYGENSYIFYGEFCKRLNLQNTTDKISSIWEEDILNLIHPNDIPGKYLEELYFHNFMMKQPLHKYSHYCLYCKLRMRGQNKNYISVLHRIFYIPIPSSNRVQFALCVYSPMINDFIHHGIIMDTTNGKIIDIEANQSDLLTAREKQVLTLVSNGMLSKNIAEYLSISIHTVNRHRQEILGKLRVKNSIEACRIAKEIGLI